MACSLLSGYYEGTRSMMKPLWNSSNIHSETLTMMFLKNGEMVEAAILSTKFSLDV